ncbi:DUF4255 domain-containing protein [Haloferula chungangensis]|uniref:DUF4255 domain-containing protein n=1 Tax=Haloferula chungangensis TaxID=1048331 RepID=A0ABW2L3H5_9BACT
MPLKPTSLSHACASIRSFLSANMEDVPADISLQIGSPGEVTPANGNQLNLFFYRFEPTAYGPMSRPGDPLRIRLYCLFSAFGVPIDNVSGGENEMRMLGEVMRLFHESPILALSEFIPPGASHGDPFRAEAIFHSLSEDQVSQFWNVSGDQGIRPSIAYEFSLIPIVPETRRVEPPRVGAIGAESLAKMGARHAPVTTQASPPAVRASRVDIRNPLWEPQIAWVAGGALALSQILTKTEAAGPPPQLWIAGDPAGTVELVWESWRPDTGWQELAIANPAAAPHSEEIDPENLPPATASFPQQVALPAIFADVPSSQVMLYARRTVNNHQLRSNPLLISITDS